MKQRIFAFISHFFASVVVFACAVMAMAALWYKETLFFLDGGIQVLKIAGTIDIVLGPFLTLVIWNVKKPRKELLRDFFIILALQLSALAYGGHAMYSQRPVYAVILDDTIYTISEPYIVGTPPDSSAAKTVFGLPIMTQTIPDQDKFAELVKKNENPGFGIAQWWQPANGNFDEGFMEKADAYAKKYAKLDERLRHDMENIQASCGGECFFAVFSLRYGAITVAIDRKTGAIAGATKENIR